MLIDYLRVDDSDDSAAVIDAKSFFSNFKAPIGFAADRRSFDPRKSVTSCYNVLADTQKIMDQQKSAKKFNSDIRRVRGDIFTSSRRLIVTSKRTKKPPVILPTPFSQPATFASPEGPFHYLGNTHPIIKAQQ